MTWFIRPSILLAACLIAAATSVALDLYDDHVRDGWVRVTGTVVEVIERDCRPLQRNCSEQRYFVEWRAPGGSTHDDILGVSGPGAHPGDTVELAIDVEDPDEAMVLGHAAEPVLWLRILAGGLVVMAAIAAAVSPRRRRRFVEPEPAPGPVVSRRR